MNRPNFPLRVVDGLTLPPEYRKALRPGEDWKDATGSARQLPRYFYEIPSWDSAMKIELASNFLLWEFIQVDVREAPPLPDFPPVRSVRYHAPGSVSGAVPGGRGNPGPHLGERGYRSPSHRFSKNATPHAWGTAANIYRIGDTYLDNRSAIERFSLIARQTLPGIWTRPYGTPTGYAEDHLHLDLGYVLSIPRDVQS